MKPNLILTFVVLSAQYSFAQTMEGYIYLSPFKRHEPANIVLIVDSSYKRFEADSYRPFSELHSKGSIEKLSETTFVINSDYNTERLPLSVQGFNDLTESDNLTTFILDWETNSIKDDQLRLSSLISDSAFFNEYIIKSNGHYDSILLEAETNQPAIFLLVNNTFKIPILKDTLFYKGNIASFSIVNNLLHIEL